MIKTFKLGHVKVTEGDLDIFTKDISSGIASGSKATCVPLNLSKYVMAKSDPKLAHAINMADFVVADGIMIERLAKRMRNASVHRVTGITLAENLISHSKDKNWRLFFLGTTPENLSAAMDSIIKNYDAPNIVGSQDGYFKPQDISSVIEKINTAKPDILFLGLGLPQKEYFLVDHFDKLDVKFCITVGGAIDIWAGAKTRAPELIQKLGLEWLYRSIYDISRAQLIVKYGANFLKDYISPPKENS